MTNGPRRKGAPVLTAAGSAAFRHRKSPPPALHIADGTLEALKWLGLVLMTGDHINKHLLGGEVAGLFNAGRLALPLFGIVLAYNLARPGVMERGGYVRVMRRLGLAAMVATIPFVGLGGLGWGWWPLNIMATLLVATTITWLIERGGRAQIAMAIGLFVGGGLLVEFWWPALALIVGAWAYCKRPGWTALLIVIGAAWSLSVINGNAWALAAIPLIAAASAIDVRVPSCRVCFYVFYPAHLLAIWLVRAATA
jgi:TraX protein